MRITHIESGLSSYSTVHKSQAQNKKAAFRKVVELLKKHYIPQKSAERFRSTGLVRTYNKPDNRVKDKASGLTQTYKHVVDDLHLEDMINARAKALSNRKEENE